MRRPSTLQPGPAPTPEWCEGTHTLGEREGNLRGDGTPRVLREGRGCEESGSRGVGRPARSRDQGSGTVGSRLPCWVSVGKSGEVSVTVRRGDFSLSVELGGRFQAPGPGLPTVLYGLCCRRRPTLKGRDGPEQDRQDDRGKGRRRGLGSPGRPEDSTGEVEGVRGSRS